MGLDYVPSSGIFKGFVRIYYDDFLLDCRCEVEEEKLKADEESSVGILEKYLNEKLKIIVNDKTIPGKIRNVELSNNELDIDVDYPFRRKPATIIVKNLINTSIYNDQANMVIVKVNDFEEGVRLTTTVTERTFKVN